MKLPLAGALSAGLLAANSPLLQAQPAGTPVDTSTTISLSNLAPAAFAEWEGGSERPITGGNDRQPQWVVWTDKSFTGHSGLYFGGSKAPGPRHLRIGFKASVPIGTVFSRGGGQLSVLKPNVPYPGDLNDDSQWMPAQYLRNGVPASGEPSNEDLVLWTLPPGTSTQALRFTLIANAADANYAGWLAGAFITADRLINVAPLATASASSNNKNAGNINDANNNGMWGAWGNTVEADTPAVSPEHPQWVTLIWPAPVQLSGLDAFFAGFSAAKVQTYTGPANVHPRDASEADWKDVITFSGLKNGYPTQFWPNRLNFAQPLTTRAIRLQFIAPTDEMHPHLQGRTHGGKMVWLGELMALESLGTAPLQTVSLAAPIKNSHPPIPVSFTLEKPGYVTLVIEGISGKRIRNLVSETYFPAGQNTAWWDGTDDLGRDTDAARHGLYKIPAQFVVPGAYRVRGLVRDALSAHYEFPVYTGGNPPWNTPDHAGAWLSNHTPPQAALYVPDDHSPTGKEAVLLGSYVSEGTDGLAWVDLDGKKLGGKTWIGGLWTGSAYLTRDPSATAADAPFAYSGAAFEGELRLTALFANGSEKSVLAAPWKYPGEKDGDRKANAVLNGITARDGVLAASLGKIGQLLLVDAKTGAAQSSTPLPDCRGIAFDKDGHLLALTGQRLVRFNSAADMANPQEVIANGLLDPKGITLDANGNIYISDQGSSHQVRVFSADGKPLRTIGKPGEPAAGPYDPLHMNHPDGITIDSRNHLWVTENDFLPKRVSVWTLDGQLVKAFYGPSKYGGGGALDPGDKTRFLYGDESRGTLEFKLDWTKGENRLDRVLYRPKDGDQPLAGYSAGPEVTLYRGTQRYFANCYNSNPTNGANVCTLFIERNGIAQPVAAAGLANQWDTLKGDAFKPTWPAGADLNGDLWQNNGKNQAFFIWSDTNGDAHVQPNEVTMRPGFGGGVTVMGDLSFCAPRLNGEAMRFAPASFLANGAPVYDLAKGQSYGKDVLGPTTSGGDQMLAGADNQAIVTLGIKPFASQSLSGTKDGVPTWSYPSLWPGLHASHEAAKPDRPGELIGTTRLLGGWVTPPKSDAGQVFAVNGNMGNVYLFTADGLFIATLFEDSRLGKAWAMPAAIRNMDLKGITLHDENFWPTISQSPDGLIYLVDGARSSLVRIDGLESIHRIAPFNLRVSADDLTASQTFLVAAEAERQSRQGRGILDVALKTTAPKVDGKLDDWTGASWVDIDKSGIGANFDSNSKPYDISAAVSVSGDKLYAAFRTANPGLLQNSGENATAPFKTGGALDIMLGTNPNADPQRPNPVEGDERLLVTQVKGKTLALLYRAVVPGTKTPVPFASPWRTITIDRVDDISSQVELAGADGNYEISLPLAALGLDPKPGLTLRGDIGVLRGDGSQTLARTYWSNKATGITADIPSEAMLTPNLWGPWHFGD